MVSVAASAAAAFTRGLINAQARRKVAIIEGDPLRGRGLPAPSPPPPTQATADEPEQEQQHHGSDKGVEDQRDDAGAEMDTEPRQQPVADERTDQANNQIADQSETAAFHHSAGKPSGDNADDQDDQKTFVRQMHGQPPSKSIASAI